MAEIDGYQHALLGFMACSYETEMGLPGKNWIPIYRIFENSFQGDSFQASAGDILLGGGSGEIPAFRISMPQAARFFTDPNWDQISDVREIYQHYWTPEAAYLLCAGFRKLGWDPRISGVEAWVAQHIISFVHKHWAKDFNSAFGPEHLDQYGSICRLANDLEKEHLKC